MCNLASTIGWFIAALAALGGAVSSVIFAYVYPLWAEGALWAAAGWSALAIALVGIANNQLRAFCACASKSPTCVSQCGALNSLITPLIGLLFAGAAFSVWCATHYPLSDWVAWVYILLGLAAIAMIIAIMISLANLSKCQSDSPTQPKPPTSPPTGPVGM